MKSLGKCPCCGSSLLTLNAPPPAPFMPRVCACLRRHVFVAAEDTCESLLLDRAACSFTDAKLQPRTNKIDKHWKSSVRSIDMDPDWGGGLATGYMLLLLFNIGQVDAAPSHRFTHACCYLPRFPITLSLFMCGNLFPPSMPSTTTPPSL